MKIIRFLFAVLGYLVLFVILLFVFLVAYLAIVEKWWEPFDPAKHYDTTRTYP